MALRRNILLFHQGALGDFIVTWPLALALARLHPQSRVFYVTHGQKGALAEKVLRVESLDIDSGGWHHLFAEAASLPEPSARALRGAHTILNLGGSDERWTANVRAVNGAANVLSISTVAPPAYAGRQTELLIEQLRPWPAAEAAAQQILRSILDRGLGAAIVSDGPIVIHPGGGSPAKCWPAERYLDLIGRLRAQGRLVRVLLGEVELERWPASAIEKFRASGDVQTPTTLIELLNELSPASAFVGNDSGPGHLAGILGVPTVGLFGASSNPQRWRPLGPRVRVVAGALDAIEAAEVFEAVKELAVRENGHANRRRSEADGDED